MATDTLKSGYRFDRVNSKGKVIFRRDTNETLEDVEKYLKSKGIKYEVKKGASMLWIKKDKLYAYYYTTGRWHPYVENSYPKKHYRSNGIDDFITRFTKDSKNREDEGSHLACYSYPNCDISPLGCIYSNDDIDDIDEYGHKDNKEARQ